MNSTVDISISQRADGKYLAEVNVTVNGVTVSPIMSIVVDTITVDEKTSDSMDVV